jgi:hypothetical protein
MCALQYYDYTLRLLGFRSSLDRISRNATKGPIQVLGELYFVLVR